jgi:hypothetical protein
MGKRVYIRRSAEGQRAGGWYVCGRSAARQRGALVKHQHGSRRHLDGRVVPRVGVVHGRQTSMDVNDIGRS